MRALPTGTVTLLFTDVEGSTRLLHELGAVRYGTVLAEHRQLVRRAFARHDGIEVDTEGDAFFYAFPTASAALDAAREAQEALSAGPIRVRMGIHTGTPHLADEGYVGADVHRAARVAACGHGGQVLVSATTAALANRSDLRDLGEHRLKDLSAPERIYQLGAEAFPPLKSLYQTNLPVPTTAFLGREKELAEVVDLLAYEEMRLVTLTGPGARGRRAWRCRLRGSPPTPIQTASGGFPWRHSAIRSSFFAPPRTPSGGTARLPSTSATDGCWFCSTTSSRWSRRLPGSVNCSAPVPGSTRS